LQYFQVIKMENTIIIYIQYILMVLCLLGFIKEMEGHFQSIDIPWVNSYVKYCLVECVNKL
jgi:hypothetical protein